MSVRLDQCFPAGPRVGARELLTELAKEPADGALAVGDGRIHEFLALLGKELLKPVVARRFPELARLGFFLRPVELSRALSRLPERTGEWRFPRGMVFHITPANVDTLFAYSWALSALAGNVNVVRVSSRVGAAARLVLDVLNTLLANGHPVVAQTQRMISYGHDDSVTADLSAACDLRVIWGGDRAIEEVRRAALRPSGRDLTFPDRSSFTVISADGWLAADAVTRESTARAFYNDAYWFDQAACASPRAIFWVGDQATTRRAQADFHSSLIRVVESRRPQIDVAMAIEKRVATYGLAADGAATAVRFAGNALATVELSAPELMPRRWLGAGTFPQCRVDRLGDLVPLVTRQDQTVTHFGFDRATLTGFARALAGRGVDRLVRIGNALNFESPWDGYDLLHEYTRITTVVA
ncbi:MAG: acyl-CoA reductase [Pseudonocardiaceae bacterium]